MARRRKGGPLPAQPSQPEAIQKAIAKAVLDGDIVNFRHLFTPLSPARPDTVESLADAKYGFFQPTSGDEQKPEFQAILAKVRQPDRWAHIEGELTAKRPAQVPSDLLIELADNAVRLAKYASAAQAYEQLRIRPRMRDEFYAQGAEALRQGDIARGVLAYMIASGLEYNYAAFPEPLPHTANFQSRALMLHAEFPSGPEKFLPLQEPNAFLRIALAYLLDNPEGAAQLDPFPIETRIEFLKVLAQRRDPHWNEFAKRFREACELAIEIGERLKSLLDGSKRAFGLTAEDLAGQLGEDPCRIPAILLGRTIENGAWWQYLKDLAYQHPPAVLFVARQTIGPHEIIVPVCTDSPAMKALGLELRGVVHA